MERVYLDHCASAPLRPEARAAMIAAMDAVGNPSSVHAEGRAARAIVEAARRTLARAFGDETHVVTFTSGASEAAATLLTPSFQRTYFPQQVPCTSLALGAGEHSCVLSGGRFSPGAVDVVPLDRDGRVRVEALEAILQARPGPVLVAVQTANNETGVIQPLEEIAFAVDRNGGAFVADAVQSFGRAPLSDIGIHADAWFVSSHKIGGPRGVGAIVRAADAMRWDPLVAGGGQERGLRAGTENVAAIAGFAAAVEAAMRDREAEAARLGLLRDALEAGLKAIAPDLVVFGEGAPRLPNVTCLAVPGVAAETALMAFDLAGFALSSGSACSSGKVKASHVLAAMGAPPDLSLGALRISLGWTSVPADVERLIAAAGPILARLRRSAAAA